MPFADDLSELIGHQNGPMTSGPATATDNKQAGSQQSIDSRATIRHGLPTTMLSRRLMYPNILDAQACSEGGVLS